MQKLISHAAICQAYAPQSSTGVNADCTGVSMKFYQHATILIETGAWAAGTVAVILRQDTDVGLATAAKALANAEYWAINPAVSSLATRTAVVANTFNLAAANRTVIIELNAEQLDVQGGFDCFGVNLVASGANADFMSVTYIMWQGRYVSEAGMPNAFAN